MLLVAWVCHATIGASCLQVRSIDITTTVRHARQTAVDGVNADAFAFLLYFAVRYSLGHNASHRERTTDGFWLPIDHDEERSGRA